MGRVDSQEISAERTAKIPRPGKWKISNTSVSDFRTSKNEFWDSKRFFEDFRKKLKIVGNLVEFHFPDDELGGRRRGTPFQNHGSAGQSVHAPCVDFGRLENYDFGTLKISLCILTF